MSSLSDHNFKDLPTDWRHDGPLSARNDEKHMPAVTPPTVHDSDRKAGKECSVVYRSSTPVSYYAETMTLIIARHHAEERAAVEKVRGVLNELERLLTTYSRLDSKCSFCMIPQHYADAALTALRTASQQTPHEHH